MGSYIQSNLIDGEKVVCEAKLHWIVFLGPIVLGLFIAIGFLLLIIPLIAYLTNEYALTNKRLMIKIGWLSRRTLELNLSKIESVSVDQSILGRILNYGTIVVNGSGGTHEPFRYISNPLEFRRAIMEINHHLEEKANAALLRT